MKRRFCVLFVAFAAFCCSAIFVCAQTAVSDLKPAHRAVLQKWLAAKSGGWRLALEKDYGKDNLKFLRDGEGANFRPFYAARDFNRDGREDFAVMLVNSRGGYAVAVFNAPHAAQPKPAFFTDRLETGDILYYNRHSRLLIVGPYASDSGFMLKPKGKTYTVAFNDEEN